MRLAVPLAACHECLQKVLVRSENTVRKLREIEQTTADLDTRTEISSITRGSTREIDYMLVFILTRRISTCELFYASDQPRQAIDRLKPY